MGEGRGEEEKVALGTLERQTDRQRDKRKETGGRGVRGKRGKTGKQRQES